MFIQKFIKQEEQAADGGVAPVAAPAAVAPVQAPTPEVAPEATPVAKPTPQLNYKDPASKQVGTMLTAAGIDPIQARDAITANDGQCTPEIYAALVEKHGEGMASVLVSQMNQLHKAGLAKGTKADEAIYAQVEEAFKGITEQSGAETFAELSTWAKDNISLEDRKELNAAIAYGGMIAKLAVQELTNMFQESGDYGQPMIGLEGDNVPSAPKGGDLTRQDYNAQLDALLAKGHVYGQSNEIATLDARRTRSAQRGI